MPTPLTHKTIKLGHFVHS